MAPPACFHCGLPVDAPGRWRAPVLGAERDFCCAGCEAVARAIVAGGFERYYETRDAASGARAPLPAELPSAALYDDPAALREFAGPAGGGAGLEATLLLENIRCAACLWLVEQTLRRAPGVLRADVNYTTRRALVAWDPARTRLSALVESLRALGYDACPWDPRREDGSERARRRADLWRLFVAGFGAMQVMMYAFPAYLDAGAGTLSADSERLMRWASLLLTLPVLLFSCGPFFAGAGRELRRLRPGMDTPLALGIAAGFGASAWATFSGRGEVYFDSIAMLVFLLLAARQLESAVRRRAARGIDRLMRWAPDFAHRLAQDGGSARVLAHLLVPGDRVRVAAGERVPADGIVERGRSSVDESLLTGEARPLARAPGERVLAGTTNLAQPLEVRVERAGGETRAAAIARLVERGAATRPALVAAADRIAFWLTWAVLATAAAAGAYWHSLWVAVTVLVVTCPCALALAAPVAVAAAGGRLARGGVALTRAGALEALARATDVVLDKTGTLTEGKVRIAAIHTLGTARLHACLALARGLEAASRHPLARAFDDGPPAAVLDDVAEFPGRGIEGRTAEGRVRIGSLDFCRGLAGEPELAPEAGGGTEVYLAGERGFLAVFSLEDSLRADSARAVRALQAAGLRVHLVSGDQPAAVAAAARPLGIATWSGGVSPEGKFGYVEALQREGRVVAMVGDGLNDAPVLARADVSIAMGGGADTAQRQADLVLLGDSLAAAAGAFGLARRAMRIIRENFAWALAYNAAALPLAAAGWIGPWEAAAGMAASSFIVVLNAMRVDLAAREPRPWKASTSSSLSPSRSYS